MSPDCCCTCIRFPPGKEPTENVWEAKAIERKTGSKVSERSVSQVSGGRMCGTPGLRPALSQHQRWQQTMKNSSRNSDIESALELNGPSAVKSASRKMTLLLPKSKTAVLYS